MLIEKGDRVGAFLSSGNQGVNFFGWGVYQGHEVPPKGITKWGKAVVGSVARILLDDGKTIWGCECWYGLENRIQKMLGKLQIIQLDIEEERKKYIKR